MAKKESIVALSEASRRRTEAARRRVETAIHEMQRSGEKIDFKSLAAYAKCSRQYLYTHFKPAVTKLRNTSEERTVVLDGEPMIVRTPQGSRTIEIALRNKVTALTEEIKQLKKQSLVSKQTIERALGEAEHWREQCLIMSQELSELRSRAKLR